MRDRVVRHIQTINEILKGYLNQNVEAYLLDSGMEHCGVWATDAEIFASAHLIERDIVILSNYGREMKWLRYPASFNLNITTADAVFLEKKEHTLTWLFTLNNDDAYVLNINLF